LFDFCITLARFSAVFIGIHQLVWLYLRRLLFNSAYPHATSPGGGVSALFSDEVFGEEIV
jgi:hypothetical protein